MNLENGGRDVIDPDCPNEEDEASLRRLDDGPSCTAREDSRMLAGTLDKVSGYAEIMIR